MRTLITISIQIIGILAQIILVIFELSNKNRPDDRLKLA